MQNIGAKYGVEFDFFNKKTYDVVGCEHCNHSGYYDRIGVFEILIIDDAIRELITNDASTMKIKEEAMKNDYKPLVIDGINKVLNGITTLQELTKILVIF